jgi:hypothetical protein
VPSHRQEGDKRIARVPNEVIYEQTGIKPLTRILKASSDTSAMYSIFALYDPAHGHRKWGQSRLRFTEYVASLITVEPEGYTRDTIIQLAQNRNQWRIIVAGAVTF